MKKLTLYFIFLSFSISLMSQNINENLSTISKSIIDQLAAQNKKTIAIVDFSSPNGDISELGRSLSNKLRINIAKNTQSVTIVNRSVLQNALAEEQLFKDGVINPETAKKIKFIGVEVIILGEISDYGNNYSIEIQLIDTERSDIVGGEILEIPKTESLRKLNDNVLTYGKSGSSKSGSRKPTKKTRQGDVSDFYPIERELGDIKVKIEGVKYSGNKVSVSYKAYNNTGKPMSIGLYCGNGNGGTYQTKINNDGDIHFSSSIRIANKSCASSGCYQQEIISSQSWIKGNVDFENFPSIYAIEVLQIYFYYYNAGYKYQNLTLRDIPIE